MKFIAMLMCTFFILSSCSTEDSVTGDPLPELVLIQSYNLDVAEPSDLTYDENSNSLWTVSDNNSKVYNLNFNGDIIEELSYIGDDLEGIVFDPLTNTLWLAEESHSQIVNIDLNGNELARHQLPIPQGTNSGIEGICFNKEGNLSLVKEKDPGKYLALSNNYSVIFEQELDFAADYAAITFDHTRNAFWIVSDQNEKIYLWTPTSGVMQEFSLPCSKPEGICFIPSLEIFYIVSDSENKLFKLEIQ